MFTKSIKSYKSKPQSTQRKKRQEHKEMFINGLFFVHFATPIAIGA